MGEMLQDAYMKKDIVEELKFKEYNDLSLCDLSCLEDYIELLYKLCPVVDSEDYKKLSHRLFHILEIIVK